MEAFKTLVESKGITFVDGDINYNALYKLWTTGEIFDTEKSSGLELNYVGLYYEHVKKDPELMKQYFLMAIERGNSTANEKLTRYYISNFVKEYQEALPYFYKYQSITDWVVAVNKIYLQNLDITPEIIDHLTSVKDEHLQMLPKLAQTLIKTVKEKLDTLELHFKYAPGAAGYEECKTDFYNQISTTFQKKVAF